MQINIVIFKTYQYMKILHDLLQFLVSGFGTIFLCVLGNNNKNVTETLKHLKNLIKGSYQLGNATVEQRF